MNLYFIRHARQDSLLCNVDVPLSNIGKMQAELLGQRLKAYEIDGLYSSDMLRAVETAEIVNRQLEAEHKIVKNLREINYGLWEGKTDAYISEHYGELQEERERMILDVAFPEGECGQEVFDRAFAEMEQIVREGRKNVAVVTHGGVIRSLVAGILGMSQAKRLLFGRTLENTGITHIYYNEERQRFYLERFNDFAHLEQDSRLLRNHWK